LNVGPHRCRDEHTREEQQDEVRESLHCTSLTRLSLSTVQPAGAASSRSFASDAESTATSTGPSQKTEKTRSVPELSSSSTLASSGCSVAGPSGVDASRGAEN